VGNSTYGLQMMILINTMIMPEDATYTIPSSRNHFDYARIARCHERQRKQKERRQEVMMDMSLSFPVFYINMDKSFDRRKRMKRNFGDLWDLRRFPGVDGCNESLVKSLVAPEDYEAILPYLVEKRTKVKENDQKGNEGDVQLLRRSGCASAKCRQVAVLLRIWLGVTPEAAFRAGRAGTHDGREKAWRGVKMTVDARWRGALVPCA